MADILIADDSEMCLLLLQQIVESLGYSCDLARTGAEILDRLRQNRYQLALLDYYLPDQNAPALLEAIEASSHSLRIVIVSSDDCSEIRTRCLERGASKVLRKPYTVATIRAVLSELMPS